MWRAFTSNRSIASYEDNWIQCGIKSDRGQNNLSATLRLSDVSSGTLTTPAFRSFFSHSYFQPCLIESGPLRTTSLKSDHGLIRIACFSFLMMDEQVLAYI